MPTTIDRFGSLRNQKLTATLSVTGGSCPHVHGAVAVGSSNDQCAPSYYNVEPGLTTVGFVGSLYGTSARLINMGPDLVAASLSDDYGFPGADTDNPKLWAGLSFGLGTGEIGVGAVNLGRLASPTSFSLSPSLLAVYDYVVHVFSGPFGQFPDALDQPCARVLTGNQIILGGSTFLETTLAVRLTLTAGDGSALASHDRSGMPLGYTANLSGFADARPPCQWWADACAGTLSNTDPGLYRDYYSAAEQLNGSYLLRPYGVTNFPVGGPFPAAPRPFLPAITAYWNLTAASSDVNLAGCAMPAPCNFWPWPFLGTPDTLLVRRRLLLTHYRRLVVQTAIRSGGPPGGRASGFGNGQGGSVGNQFVYRRAATDLWPRAGAVTLAFDPTPTNPLTGEPGSDPVYPGVTVPGSITITPTGFLP
jgi:hypothetical protein